jgi:VanZ family protein
MILRFLWPAILWTIIVLVLTLIPGRNLPDVRFFQFDKLVHIFIFAVMMLLTCYGLKKISEVKNRPVAPVRVAMIYSIIFGIGIEVIQQFVPGRSFSLADVLANCIGVALAYLIFNSVFKKRKLDTVSGDQPKT